MKKQVIESLIIGGIVAFTATTMIALFTYHGWQWEKFGGIASASIIAHLVYKALRGSSLPYLINKVAQNAVATFFVRV